MSKKRRLDAIVAAFTERSQARFSSSAKPGQDYDYVKTYLIHASFDLYAIHDIMPGNGFDEMQSGTDARFDARFDAASGAAGGPKPSCNGGESSLRVRMGTLSGYLILCPEMIYDKYDPLTVCDDHSADLEYVMSALTDTGGPLNPQTGEPKQNVFYIENLEIDAEYKTQRLGLRIIRELPFLVREFLHVYPDLLAYRPSPLASEWDDVSERVNALRSFAMERLSTRIELMLARQKAPGSARTGEPCDGADGAAGTARNGQALPSGQKEGATDGPPADLLSGMSGGDNGPAANGRRIATIAVTMPEYDFSEDEINLIMGRRSHLSEYPESFKDPELFRFFEKCGFHEVSGSRLLFRKSA